MAERGSLVVELRGAVGGGEVSCVDVAGARLTAGGGRALRVWQWAAGAGWTLAGAAPHAHRYCVTCARWAPAGALLGSGGVDGVVRLWGCGAEGLEERAALAAAGACGVRALCWAGARLLAGHDDGAATVWLWARGELAAVLRAHAGSLHALAAAADGALMLTACTEGVLKLHDLEEVCAAGVSEGTTATSVAPLAWEDGAHDLGALCAASTARGGLLATGGQDGRVRLWRVERGGDAGRGRLHDAGLLDGHSGAVTGMVWGGARSADGARILASCSLDRTARLWAVPDGPAPARGEPCCVLLLHAHTRYLTCVALDPDLRYLVTGSNDKSVRTWSLGALTLDAALRPPCAPLQHFALGDLEGIGPVADVAAPAEAESAAAAAWRGQPHAGAVNCLASRGDLLASASSDGTVRVFRWEEDEEAEESAQLVQLAALAAHTDGVAGVAWGDAGESMLLSVAFDGHAVLWDIDSGNAVRSLRLVGAAGGGGGGAARGAALAGRCLLLAADELGAPLWDLDEDSPEPAHVYECGGSARCVSWAPGGRQGGRLAALGGGGGGGAGELRLLAAPPAEPATLYHDPAAHELEIESVAWSSAAGGSGRLTLGTAGAEGLVKLWLVQSAGADEVQVQLARSLVAHGGGARALAWGGGGGGALLASGGGDSWARVWAPKEAAPRAVLPSPAPGGVTALAFLQQGSSCLVSVGGLDGSVGVWRLGAAAAGGAGSSAEGEEEAEDGADARCWGGAGVLRWLREYVTSPPGARAAAGERGEALAAAAAAAGLSGARLLDDPLEDIIQLFGFHTNKTSDDEEVAADGVEEEDSQVAGEGEEEEEGELGALRARLLDELLWLRRELPDHETEAAAPHALQCPVRHAAWREPARAADGVTYDRAALHEHWRAAGGVCVLDGARLAHRRVAPNYRARTALRAWLRARHDAALAAPARPCHPRCYFCRTRADE